jgi:hypothetical protein
MDGSGAWPSLNPAARCSWEGGAGTFFIAKITRNPRMTAMAIVRNIGVLLVRQMAIETAALARYLIISL